MIATASADGTPNITYLSRVRVVDDERVALSNQFFSKTARNLAENPRASVLVIDPLTLRRVPARRSCTSAPSAAASIFEQLREDVDAVAAVSGMQDVFKLRAADIYRVTEIEQAFGAGPTPAAGTDARTAIPRSAPEQLGELTARLSRCTDLDAIVSTTVEGLAELLGFGHSLLLLLDEDGRRLYTIASHGYPDEGVGSEVDGRRGHHRHGRGACGADPRRQPAPDGQVRHERAPRRTRRHGDVSPGWEIAAARPARRARATSRCPRSRSASSSACSWSRAISQVAFTEADQANLSVLASVVANAIEAERARDRVDDDERRAPAAAPVPTARHVDPRALLRGRRQHVPRRRLPHQGRRGSHPLVAARPLRRASGAPSSPTRKSGSIPSLELPEFRDNLDSRLILLKRRLDERRAPIRIEKTGRGRFRLVVTTGAAPRRRRGAERVTIMRAYARRIS